MQSHFDFKQVDRDLDGAGVWVGNVRDDSGTRACIKCGVRRLLARFTKKRGRKRGREECRVCDSRRMRAAKYKLTEAEVRQWERVTVCGNPGCAKAVVHYPQATHGKGHGMLCAHLDHCHKTGTVRDVLCSNCNIGLGCCKDSPAILRGLADYIDQHNIDVRQQNR